MTQHHHNTTTAQHTQHSSVYMALARHSHLWRCPVNSLITRRARTRSWSTSVAPADEAMAGHHEQWCNIIISISSSSSSFYDFLL